jgi:hypothetical protein
LISNPKNRKDGAHLGLLEEAREKLVKVCRQRGVDLTVLVEVYPLTPK